MFDKVLNMPWVLNMPGLHTVLGMPECTMHNFWICLIMLEYTGICVNMPKRAWVAFDLHVSIVIPCLLEQVVTYFNEVYSLKENETVFWRDKIWFFPY